MPVLRNVRRLITCPADGSPDDLGGIDRAAMVWRDGRITWVGREADLPASEADDTLLDARQSLVLPGLVDAHTHLAFGGWRADEFARRAAGATYLDIAREGGGIRRTVRDTTAATEDELLARCSAFLADLSRCGTTTVECKTGYGLTADEEMKLLRVYARLARRQPQRLVSTLLAAHALPDRFASDRPAYVRHVVEEMLPAAAAMPGPDRPAFCDVFVEEGAFSADEARTILRAAAAHGLRAKLHVDQLTDGGGGRLAAELDAISADHLEYVSDEGIAAMAEAGVVAVLLPIATLYLRQEPLDARRVLAVGGRVAVATDFNPGSAPAYDLRLAMTLACTMSRLSPAQALRGATIEAARAIDRDADVGSLEPGKWADFVLVEARDVDQLVYHYRPEAVRGTWIGGDPVYLEAF